jgi:hypothetical protein
MPAQFHNNYQFVPFADRLSGDLGDLGELIGEAGGTGIAAPHSAYLPEHLTGTITVDVTVASPVVVIDPNSKNLVPQSNGHLSFDVVRDAAGRPEIPASTVKGSLRSFFELASQSRLGVFGDHAERLGLREEATEVWVAPARIDSIDARNNQARLTVFVGANDETEHAAWFPVGFASSHTSLDAWFADTQKKCCEGHAEQVRSWLSGQLSRGSAWPLALPVRNIRLEKVLLSGDKGAVWRLAWKDLQAFAVVCPVCEDDISFTLFNDVEPEGAHYREAFESKTVQRATVLVTGRPGGGIKKHDERVAWGDEVPFEVELDVLSDAVAARIDAAFAAREDWTKGRDVTRNDAVRYARALLTGQRAAPPGWHDPVQRLVPKPGTWCFAHLAMQGQETIVTRLTRVIMGRDLHESPPASLLDDSHRRADRFAELSPADRIFGWTPDETKPDQSNDQPLAGRIAPSAATIVQAPPNSDLAAPLWLAVLSSPKPQQGRFYLGVRGPQDRYVRPQEPKQRRRQIGYGDDRRLRGYKVYPHHKDKEGYQWAGTGGLHRNPGGPMDEQSRTIRGWIAPGTTMRFTLDVLNLHPVELAGLLACLGVDAEGKITPGWHLRLGFAKPLGFGSLRTDDVRCDLRTGEEICAWLGDWTVTAAGGPTGAVTVDLRDLVAPAAPMRQAPTWLAVQRTALGIGSAAEPVAYPYVTGEDGKLAAGGKTYEWFGENDRIVRGQIPEGRSLPDFAAQVLDPLPAFQRPARRRGARPPGRRR